MPTRVFFGGGSGGGQAGASGGLTPQTITASQTAAAGIFYAANCTAGPVVLTLPALPPVGTVIGAEKSDASANSLTINPATGGTINGDGPNQTYTVTQGGGGQFMHLGSNVWQIVAVTLSTGPAGPTGPQGIQGIQGIQGATGPSGAGSVNIGFIVPTVSGRWGPVGVSNNFGGPGAMTNGELVAVPFIVARNVTVTGIAANYWSAASAGGLLRFGIYSSSGDIPAALLADFGTVAATGSPFALTGLSQALVGGSLYWVAVVVQGSPSTAPQFLQMTNNMQTFTTVPTSSLPNNPGIGYSITGLNSGALPGAWGAPSSSVSAPPRIYLQVA